MDVFDLVAKISLDSSAYESGLNSAKNFGSKVMSGVGTAMKTAGVAIASATTALTAFAKSSISTGIDFDSAMSQISATMGLTVEEIQNNVNGAGDVFDALRAKAQEMGETTNFTATEAAEGLNILAMSGYSANESIAMIEDVLHLAAAGSMDMASAADYVAGSMKGFNDATKDSGYYADLMAKGATLANTSVSELGEAMADGSASAAAYGQTAESMVISLLRLAEQGEAGSAASTALAAAMKNIYTPTKQASDAMEKLGISAYDSATGKARDFNDVVNELSAALSGMSDAEANAYKDTIFGIQGLDAFNKMAVTSTDKQYAWMDALDQASISITDLADGLNSSGIAFDKYSWAGIDGIKNLSEEIIWNMQNIGTSAEEMKEYLHFEYDMSYEDAELAIETFNKVLEESSGEAAKQYSTMTDNLQGDIDLFNSALDGLKVAVSDSLTGTAREFVQFGANALSNITAGFKEGGIDGAMKAVSEMLTKALDMAMSKLSTVVGFGLNFANAIVKSILNNIGVISKSAGTILKTIVTGLTENLPSIASAAVSILSALGVALVEALPSLYDACISLLNGLVNNIHDNIGTTLPTLLQTGMEMLSNIYGGIADALPDMIPKVVDIIVFIVETLLDNLPELVECGLTLLTALFEGIINALPTLIIKIPEIVIQIVKTLIRLLPKLAEAGGDMIASLLKGIVLAVPAMLVSIGEQFMGIVAIAMQLQESLEQAGYNLVVGFWNGIKERFSTLKEDVTNLFGGVVDTVKNIFQIKSPSRVFRQIGEYCVEGFDKGVDDLGDMSSIESKINAGINGLNISGINANITASDKANNQNVTVVLEGDANALFRAIRNENGRYQRATGRSAFA